MADSTSIRASREAVIGLRRIAGRLSAETGRTVSLSDALAAVVGTIGQDIDAVLGNLPDTPPQTDDRPGASYGERRPYAVADNLDNLRGPTAGTVTLPHHLDWSGSPTYDLDSPGLLASMYQTVLAEAGKVDDLNRWIARDELVRVWPNLYLPRKIRSLWEQKFPELSSVEPTPA